MKLVETSSPLHTDKIKGHNPNDILIIYLKYEDMVKDETKRESYAKGLYVPQWFATDLVSETAGIFLSTNTPTLCTYKQMEEMARNKMDRFIRGGVSAVKYYYSNTLMSINGMNSFL